MDATMSDATGPPHSYNQRQRVAMALAYALFILFGGTLMNALTTTWPEGQGGPPKSAVKHCKHWYERLLVDGSVFDRPRRLGWRKLPDATALEAAKLVKEGVLVSVVHRHDGPPIRRVWFHSLDDAIRHVPRLRAIMTQFQVTPDYLLHRMHEVDKGLHWGKLDIKGTLKEEHKSERKRYAADLLACINADPLFLDRFVWVDEVKIWLFGGSSSDVCVWCDAHDEGVHLVVPGCGKVGAKPTRVCMYTAVNAKLGLVGFQYTHPTTGFPDTWKQEAYPGAPGAKYRADPDYKVGTSRGRGVNTRLPKQSTSVWGVSVWVCMRSSTSHRKAQRSLSPIFAAYGLGWKPVVSTRMGSAGAALRACSARTSAAPTAAEPTS